MRDSRERLLAWTADVEDDLADLGRTRVFVPSIMGAGILVSLGILVGDLRRSLVGRTGEARRRVRIRRAARALVVPIAVAIGAELPPVLHPRRRLRSRTFYACVFVGAVSLSLYVAIGSTLNYIRQGGYLEAVHWVEAVAIAASVFFFAVGAAAMVVALRYPVVPRWLRPVIDRSPLGALEPLARGPASGRAR